MFRWVFFGNATGICSGSCNPRYWEVGIWGWFGVLWLFVGLLISHECHMSVTCVTWVSALGCLIIQCRPNSKANGLAMLKHLFHLFEYRSKAALGVGTVSTRTNGWPPYGFVVILTPTATGIVSHREELIQCIALHPHCYALSSSQWWRAKIPHRAKLPSIP
jgi:hypothetical protein